MIFSQNSHFFEINRSRATLWIWRWHRLFYNLINASKSSTYSGQEILGLLSLMIIKNMVNSIKFSKVVSFFAGPSLASLAIVSVWQSCGKPSTKFPHGGLGECLCIPQFSCLSFRKIQKFRKFSIFS